jgi:hypothetical protein
MLPRVAVRSVRGLGLNADAPAVRTEEVAARRAATEIARATLVASCAETAAHSDDVDVIAEGLCRHMGLEGAEREDVLAAARLHDIGKIAVPSEILHKPETLDDGEWSVIHRHTEVGASIIAAVPELASVATLVRHSHERWDGRGYPDGLAGEEIPLGSRIVFCADAFHAIRSDRPYRPGRPAGAALREIHAHAGTDFDPDVVGALRSLATETRLVTSRNGLTRRSSRLVALLMILACGVGGSALGRSGVLGTPSAVGPAPAQAAAGGPAAAPFGQPTLLSPAGAMCARDACEPRLLTVPLSAVGLGVKQGSVAAAGVAGGRQEAGLTGNAEGAGASGDGRDAGAVQPGDASAGAGGTAPAEAEGPAPSGGKSGDLSGTKGSGSQSSPAPGGTSGSDSPSSGGKTATESKGSAGSTQTAPAPTSPPDTTATVPKTSTPTKSSTPLAPAPTSSEPAPAPSGGKAPAEGKGA